MTKWDSTFWSCKLLCTKWNLNFKTWLRKTNEFLEQFHHDVYHGKDIIKSYWITEGFLFCLNNTAICYWALSWFTNLLNEFTDDACMNNSKQRYTCEIQNNKVIRSEVTVGMLLNLIVHDMKYYLIYHVTSQCIIEFLILYNPS